MSRRAEPILLSDQERATLQTWARARIQPLRVIQRAKIILLAAEGVESQEIARQERVSRPTWQLWRGRLLALRTAGLEKDAPRPGRIPALSARKRAAIVEATLHSQPPNATHCSTRRMAKAQGVSEATVRRIWKQHGLRPHRVSTFKVSRDPRFVEKLTDVVGLYLNPPDQALVLCVDEKSQIQALDRSQPVLPMRPGQVERRTHDYTRHGTTTLFAALNAKSGKLITEFRRRQRAREFRKFLDTIQARVPATLEVHLILDNSSTHKTPAIHRWLTRHPRFHLHFTPTSSSWINLVERWFAALTEKQLRRGVHRSTRELEAAIQRYIEITNGHPTPFVWTKTADEILESVARFCHRISNSGH